MSIRLFLIYKKNKHWARLRKEETFARIMWENLGYPDTITSNYVSRG